MQLGDIDATPYGGGTWASRGAGVGGEAAWQAARALRGQMLDLAGSILQARPGDLDIADGAVVDAAGRAARIGLADLARIAYFRPGTLPRDVQPELVATRHYVPRDYPFAFTNGVQASWLEVDTETGFVTLLKHFVVEDCGTVLNPLLVTSRSAAAWCRAWAPRCSSSASTTTWCRWRARCRTSPSPMSARPRWKAPSGPRARARPARQAPRPAC